MEGEDEVRGVYPDADLHRRHSEGFRERSMPLGEVTVWEPSSRFDRFCVAVYGAGAAALSRVRRLCEPLVSLVRPRR
jgi:hypothetical protein